MGRQVELGLRLGEQCGHAGKFLCGGRILRQIVDFGRVVLEIEELHPLVALDVVLDVFPARTWCCKEAEASADRAAK
jgi:hypothetical protein